MASEKYQFSIFNLNNNSSFAAMKTIAVLFVVIFVALSAAHPQGGGGGGSGGVSEHIEHPHHGKSHQKVWLKNEHEKKIEIKAHPKFHYGYDVHDSHTHDIKNKHETRDGYHVKGEYSLLEPDHKHIRIVQYESDKKTGWNAKVIRKPVHH